MKYKARYCFRVYLGPEKGMLYSESWSGIQWDQILQWIKDGVIMQAIGLKDIHEKPIYEGDVVEVFNTYKEEYFKGSVHFNNGSFFIRKDDLTSHYRWINYDIKVIGNIYENPKLLVDE